MKVEPSVVIVMHGDPVHRSGCCFGRWLGLTWLTLRDLIRVEVVATQHGPQLRNGGGLRKGAHVSIVLLGRELGNGRDLICSQFTTLKCLHGDRQFRRSPGDTDEVCRSCG